MHTRRLYYGDSYLREFHARVLAEEGRRVYLDETAFYPASGGQPFDLGTINGVAVLAVEEEDGGRIAHHMEAGLAVGPAECVIDWQRRFDHMQQHTGQHILSAVLSERFGVATVSFHMGREVSTIDLATGALDASLLLEAERFANEAVFEARAVTVSYHEPGEELGLRKSSERGGTLRVVAIGGLDRSACGGTHVRSTAEVGAILLRKPDKVRGNVRLEFVCGMRAVRQARADYAALSRTARLFSAPLEGVDELVAAQGRRLAAAEKELRRLSGENARRQGRDRFGQAVKNGRGWCVEFVRAAGPMDDASRERATEFTACGAGVWVELFTQPPAVLMAASPGTGVNAGSVLKPLLAAAGGRGGGSAAMAQGSLPGETALNTLEAELRKLLA